MKQRAIEQRHLAKEPDYEPIEVPRNSPTGVICAFFASFTGFAVIWHIWWLAILGLVGAFATLVWYSWRDDNEVEIPADEVARLDRERRHVRSDYLKTLEQPA
jgi:cytochrome o ubiquinol oxidase subunit 1